jgi:hypothetical protein
MKTPPVKQDSAEPTEITIELPADCLEGIMAEFERAELMNHFAESIDVLTKNMVGIQQTISQMGDTPQKNYSKREIVGGIRNAMIKSIETIDNAIDALSAPGTSQTLDEITTMGVNVTNHLEKTTQILNEQLNSMPSKTRKEKECRRVLVKETEEKMIRVLRFLLEERKERAEPFKRALQQYSHGLNSYLWCVAASITASNQASLPSNLGVKLPQPNTIIKTLQEIKENGHPNGEWKEWRPTPKDIQKLIDVALPS